MNFPSFKKTLLAFGIVSVMAIPMAYGAAEPIPEKVSDAAQKELQSRGIYTSVWEFVDRVKKNDVETVKLFLDAGLDPIAKARGTSALAVAMSQKHMEILNLMMPRIDDVNKWLPMAAYRGNEEIFKLFLSKAEKPSADTLKKCFMNAIEKPSLGLAQFIAEQSGSQVKTWANEALLTLANDRGNSESAQAERNKILAYLLKNGADLSYKDGHDNTALLLAANQKQINTVKTLLEAGVEVNVKSKNGMTPLSAAIEQRSPELVQLLVDKGADVNVEDEQGFIPLMKALQLGFKPEITLALLDKTSDIKFNCAKCKKPGETLLMMAAGLNEKKGVVKVLEALIKRGADVNAKSETGKTALMNAARVGSVAAVAVLVEAGADLNAVNNDGQTAAMKALEVPFSHPMFRELMKSKMDMSIKDKNGETLLMLAAKKGSGPMVASVLKAGADHKAVNEQGYTALQLAKKAWNGEAYEVLQELEETEEKK